MSILLILAVALCPPQETKTVLKGFKDPYMQALRELREVQDLLESDPRSAIDKLTGVISNRKITQVECRLRIEERSQEFTEHDFFPFQLRGRARINLAKTSPPETAKSLLDDAIVDLEKSFKDKKVAASEAFLKTARAELDRVKVELEKGKDDPYVLLGKKVEKLTQDKKFKSAATLVQGPDGKPVTDEQRQTILQSIDEQCRDFIGRQMSEFRRSLESGLTGIRSMSRDDFNRDFTTVLPREAEMTVSMAALDWARKHLPTIKAVHTRDVKVADLLTAALETVTLDSADSTEPNPWFKAVEDIAHDLIEAGITQATEDSINKPKARRAELQAKAEELRATWKGFVDKLDEKFLKRHESVQWHGESIAAIFQRFPAEIPELAGIDIDKAFTGDPVSLLAGILDELGKIEDKVDLKPAAFAVESKQDLYTKIVTANALRMLMDNKSEEDAARELGKYRRKLSDVGGAIDQGKYGPRVAKVFKQLS